MSTTRASGSNFRADLRPEELYSKLNSPNQTRPTSPVTTYPCCKPSPICTTESKLKPPVVEASLCRPPCLCFPTHGIGRVPYSYHSSVSGTFNSLFKVLCIFPSLYLFAIGLRVIFSLRRGTPPNLLSIPKLSDSCQP